MLRGFILMLTLLVSTVSYAAQRKLPNDMDAAVLKQVELPYLKVSRGGFSWTRLLTLGIADGNSAKLQITRFTKIHDEKRPLHPDGAAGRQNRQNHRVQTQRHQRPCARSVGFDRRRSLPVLPRKKSPRRG